MRSRGEKSCGQKGKRKSVRCCRWGRFLEAAGEMKGNREPNINIQHRLGLNFCEIFRFEGGETGGAKMCRRG